MGHGEAAAGKKLPQHNKALRYGAPADRESARCSAMMQQAAGHGPQSWPQQFIRLVGGYRRPAPVQRVPARS